MGFFRKWNFNIVVPGTGIYFQSYSVSLVYAAIPVVYTGGDGQVIKR